MADIYLIYGREDEALAAAVFERLRVRWTVWWDRMVKQRFVDEIAEELGRARCVVVLWSERSRVKDTVVDEVKLAQRRGPTIVSVSLDGAEPAYGFGGYSTTGLSGWDGSEEHPAYAALFARLVSILPSPEPPARPHALAGTVLPLPTLFLSVSSFETQLVPAGAVKALALARAPAILVSAWDLVPRRGPDALLAALQDYRATGGCILLDSGNYEATRLSTRHWRVDDLKHVLTSAPHDLAFAFDRFEPTRAARRTAEKIAATAERDSAFTTAPLMPVVHVPRLSGGGYLVDILPEVAFRVAETLGPVMIGVPERELGAGIAQRVATMQAIRSVLDGLPFYQPIHLLGTGNPWTVAIMAAAGADSFDGLEWCRVVVDHQTDQLNHFQHFDLFTDQTAFADLMVAREALNDDGVDFAGKVAFHNADYFLRFDQQLRDAVGRRSLEAFVTGKLGRAAAEKLERVTKGLFGR